MQKHQWRQHGIVHLKSGRSSTSSGSGEENSAVPQNYTALVKADPDSGTKSNKIQDLDQHSAVPKPIKLSYETTAENLVNNAKISTPRNKPTTTKIIHEIQTNNAETSPIKLKMKMAYQQHLIDSHNAPLHSAMQEHQEDEEEHLIKEQCKIMEKSTSKWMTSMDQDPKPLDLSSKSSLSDHNQPSLLPTINTNNFTIPKQKHITTVTTNVPTIQMSDSQRTLSKLLQNFTTKSNSNPANATAGIPESPRKVSQHMSVNNRSKLLHGLFQSETHTRAI